MNKIKFYFLPCVQLGSGLALDCPFRGSLDPSKTQGRKKGRPTPWEGNARVRQRGWRTCADLKAKEGVSKLKQKFEQFLQYLKKFGVCVFPIFRYSRTKFSFMNIFRKFSWGSQDRPWRPWRPQVWQSGNLAICGARLQRGREGGGGVQ